MRYWTPGLFFYATTLAGWISIVGWLFQVVSGGDQVILCTYGYETIGCFVEQGELVSGLFKGERLPFQLGEHFCYRWGVVVFFEDESESVMLTEDLYITFSI